MKIAKNTATFISFTLTDTETDTELEKTAEAEPFSYIQGVEGFIPGVEAALEGKSVGDEVSVSLSPEEAFGPYDAEGIKQLPKEAFKDVEKLEAGLELIANLGDGPMIIRIEKVEDEIVTIDTNHPFAGKSVRFDIKVTEVREATAEEIDHGHVH